MQKKTTLNDSAVMEFQKVERIMIKMIGIIDYKLIHTKGIIFSDGKSRMMTLNVVIMIITMTLTIKLTT